MLSEAGASEPAAGGDGEDGPGTSASTTRAQIQDLLTVFEKVARALHAAHEAGVVHRDIKPGNVMVTSAGEPVILDFGLAHAEDQDFESLTRPGDLFGTPAYMSPEQLTRGTLQLDRRTDVYSLGATLYECLTLKRPFEAPTREALYQAILSKEPPDPRSLNPAIPGDLRVVLETALAKDRDKRYQTALELAEELRRVRCYEPIVAKPAGPWTRLRRWSQRNPALATAVVGHARP
jgi:serine/threonine protein kinase